MPKNGRLVFACGALVVLAACSDSAAAPGAARLSIQLTDAPGDYVASAVVQLGAVSLIPADSGAPLVITEDAGTHDLLTLQNGVTADLASLDIPAGDYQQLRLVVQSATVTLKDGYTFPGGSPTAVLKVPSGASSGIKVNLGTVHIASGQTVIVVDFDVSQNFRIQGNPDTPAGIKGMLFTPLLRATVRDVAGSIAGTVTLDTGGVAVGRVVRGVPDTSTVAEAYQTLEVTAVTDSTGAYALRFLPPGTWRVSVDSSAADTLTVPVGAQEHVTGVDFTIAG